MAQRITSTMRKNIIARYAEVQSYRAVAKEFNVSPNGVKNIVHSDPEFAHTCAEKMEEETQDILKHMEQRKDKVCEMIDAYLDALLDPEKIAAATPSQLSTALGTILDKFFLAKDRKDVEQGEGGGVIMMPEVKKRE